MSTTVGELVVDLREEADVAEKGDCPEDGCRWSITMRSAADEIERLLKIEDAARKVANTLNGGFIRCNSCGGQEDLTDVDFADELYAALGINPNS